MEPLGLCCLSDVLRDNVTETLNYFRRQGVTLKVISGDDPRTVANIAAGWTCPAGKTLWTRQR